MTIDEKAVQAVAQAIADERVRHFGAAAGRGPREVEFDYARAAILAYESAKQKEAEGWRDIASAPLGDGWKHLFSSTEGQNIGRWEASYGASGDWMDAQGYTIWGVTHWRPLPEPPSALLSAGGEG